MKTFLAVLCLCTAVCAAGQPATAAKPNIIFILADDLGYADTGFNGSQEMRTPHLDKLAKNGAILKSFYVQPVCSPTRASLMTGRHVSHTGVYGVIRPRAPWGLPLQERTLANALHEAGYTTAIVGKWHLGEFENAYRPTRRGFDHQYGHWFGAIDYFTHKRDNLTDWHRDDQPCADQGYSTHLLAREACRLIKEQPAGKPLFLYVPFNAVHGPYQVPDQYKQPFASLSGTRRTYAGMVAAMDAAVGKIVEAVKDKGILDNTLIVFSSDNGGPAPGRITSNAPLRAGKGTIYEGGIRVCAFASWPGRIPAGKTIQEPLHIVDWYPTLVTLAGGSLQQKLPLDGCDIWPVLTRDGHAPRDTLLLPGVSETQGAIRKGEWKLLSKGGGAQAELYNLAHDIGEKTNVAAQHPEIVKELENQLAEKLKDAAPFGGAGKPPPLPSVP